MGPGTDRYGATPEFTVILRYGFTPQGRGDKTRARTLEHGVVPPFRPRALDDRWRCLHRELAEQRGNHDDIRGGLAHRWILRGSVRESRRGRGALRNGGRSHGALPRWFNGPKFDQQCLAAGDAGETAQARTHWPWARAHSQKTHSSQNRHGGVLSTGPRPCMQGSSEY